MFSLDKSKKLICTLILIITLSMFWIFYLGNYKISIHNNEALKVGVYNEFK